MGCGTFIDNMYNMHPSGHLWWETGGESCICHLNSEGNNATI